LFWLEADLPSQVRRIIHSKLCLATVVLQFY
jgi:hypothetical protein